MRAPRSGRIAAIGALSAALLAVTACSGPQGSSSASPDAIADVTDEQLDGTTITLARFFGDCEEDAAALSSVDEAVGECEVIQFLTDEFNRSNDKGITVERLGGAEWNTYYDTLNAAYAAGEPPAVAVMHGSRITDYAERGLLLPLTELAPVTDVDLDDEVDAAAAATTFEDDRYALPFDLHGALAHVNVDLLAQAGLVENGEPVLPSSPEEFLEHAALVKESTGKDYLAVARVNDGLGVRLVQSLVQQQGGDVVSEDATSGTVDSPEMREALGFVDEVFTGDFARPDLTYDAAQQEFLNGDAALLYNGTWVVDQYSETAPFEYRATNFPTLYDEPASWADTHTWVIPTQADADPVAYRAALEFVSYLYENVEAWAVGTGHLASRASVLESPSYLEAPQRANYADTGMTSARIVPQIASWQAVDSAIQQQLQAIWFDGADVDTALADADAAVDSALAD